MKILQFRRPVVKSFSKPISIVEKGHKKNALVIYVTGAVQAWIKHRYIDHNWNSHSMHWESIEMVRMLNELGYNVDFLDCMISGHKIDWEKYDLVLDETNHISAGPKINGQIKIFYATGCHWLYHNTAEWQRLMDFRDRHGLSLSPRRQVSPIVAESIADVVTYFGGSFQQNTFTNPEKCFPLNISSSFVPDFRKKAIGSSRRNIIWIGSRGFVHKGLDIVLDAFKRQKAFKLHLFTNLEAEPDFYQWFKNEFADTNTVHYHGWKSVSDPEFQHYADNSIATIYCSAAEGGAGSAVQCMQFGCIPIVNASTALRAQSLGFSLNGSSGTEFIDSIGESLQTIDSLSEQQLEERSNDVRIYANRFHSRWAYQQSFRKLLETAGHG